MPQTPPSDESDNHNSKDKLPAPKRGAIPTPQDVLDHAKRYVPESDEADKPSGAEDDPPSQ